jgi:hypothetical protein
VHDVIRISSRMPAFNNGFTASCSLSVGLAMFIRHVVQPAAVRHLGSESRCGIHGGLVNQTPENSTDEPEVSHLRAEFTLPGTNIH